MENNPILCASCAKECVDKGAAADKENWLCEDCVIKCNDCSLTFKSKPEKNKHVYNYHQSDVACELNGVYCGQDIDSSGNYYCFLCKAECKGYEMLTRHFKKYHTNIQIDKKRCWSEFDFDEGCSEVFDNKKMKVGDLAKGLGLSPVLLTLKSQDNENFFQSFALLNEETERTMESLKIMDKNTTCKIQSSKNVEARSNKIVTPTLEFVQFNNHPRFGNIMGEYTVLNEVIEQEINNKKINLEAAANLFVGGLLYIENKVILILTVEVYSRDVQVDIHGEANYESFPEKLDRRDRFYERTKIKIIQGPDRGQPISKLVIGTEVFNILVTSSYLLEPIADRVATAGPSANPTLLNCDFNNAQLLLRKENVDDYRNSGKEGLSINNCRQLTSGISNISTYFTFRRTMIKQIIMQPATIFTLHKYPLTGYGISMKNQTRKLSLFLALISECLSESNGLFGLDQLSQLQNIKINHEKLDPVLLKLQKEIRASENSFVDILEFLEKQKGLTDLVQSMSSNISTINQKVEKNISIYFTELFGQK